MSKGKRPVYVGDFETTTDPSDVRVWASCLVEIETGKTAFIGNDIESFLDFLKDKNSVVYFHNAKFDLEFVLSKILTMGYTYSEKKENKTFNTLITDMGVFYSVEVIFEKRNKKYKKVVFYDSLKKLPFKVATISKAFELKDEKLTIDYDAPRPIGHELTEDEKQYVVNDCRIVAEALKIQFSKGLTKMTNASDAMNNFKNLINKNYFEKLFPVFPAELDEKLRMAYKGGYVYLNPIYKDKEIPLGLTFDVNSLYPSVMYDKLLPCGYPIYFEGEYVPDEMFPLYIVRLRCEFEIKPDHLPTVQLKKNRAFMETEYLTSSNGEIVEMTMTNVDLELFLDHYKIYNPEYIGGFKFRGVQGLFKPYIDYWMNIKETTTGAMRQLAKLMLNSLYGKFATNPKSQKKIPFLDSDGVVRYELDEAELRDPVYTAMGAFITAYAREKTIRSGQKVFDRFIYADTDSLSLIGDDVPECLDVHPTHLGAWKNEGVFSRGVFVRCKSYIKTVHNYTKGVTLKEYAKVLNKTFDVWRNDDNIKYHEIKVTCAGMPDNVKADVTYDNFHSGSTFHGKLVPRRYKGGIVLTPTTFTIK